MLTWFLISQLIIFYSIGFSCTYLGVRKHSPDIEKGWALFFALFWPYFMLGIAVLEGTKK